jgi:hypothetical protein
MKKAKRRWIIILCFFIFALPSICFGVFLYSARIPDHWQELTAGMTRSEVAKFLADPSTTVTHDSDDEDAFRIKRPIRDWLLLVRYNEDESFRGAHLRYSSPIFGEYSRARNYNERDDPYHVRAQR